MTNEQLIEQIRTGQGTKEAIEKLYLQNQGIIWKTAREIAGKFADSESRRKDLQQELMQEAYFGLLEAVNRWEPDRGTLFISYALYWIRLSMTRYCYSAMNSVYVPESRQTQIRNSREPAADLDGQQKQYKPGQLARVERQ